MTSSKEPNKMADIVNEQREKLNKLVSFFPKFKRNEYANYNLLLDFIQDNEELQIYTVPTLKEATGLQNDGELIDLVRYFGGGHSRLFSIHYCYYVGTDFLRINEDEFQNYLKESIEPVDENGNEIEDFDPRNLSFYCLINYKE
ncbi:hypothetical protein ACIP6T_23805 [Pantoea sp. NPDC088449]|uniref:hypothetical protein n=1 Tax=Pantoea sp. NPDC088449 TaxID=3364392 RepID=UPI0038203462